MKIRTDFVTNSSSSSFITIYISTKAGKKLEYGYHNADGNVFGNPSFEGTKKSVYKTIQNMDMFIDLIRDWFVDGAVGLMDTDKQEIDEDYGSGDIEEIKALKIDDVRSIKVEWGTNNEETRFSKAKSFTHAEIALMGTLQPKKLVKKEEKPAENERKTDFTYYDSEEELREEILKEYSDEIITDIAHLDFTGKHVYDPVHDEDRSLRDLYEGDTSVAIMTRALDYIVAHGGILTYLIDETTDYILISTEGFAEYNEMNRLNSHGANVHALFASDFAEIIMQEYVQKTGENGHIVVSKMIAAMFAQKKNIVHVEIADGIDRIPAYSFAEAKNLSYIRLPESLLEIGDYAFKFCTSLESISLPENLKKIGEKAFQACVKLNNIVLPENLETIAEEAFGRCIQLSEIAIPKACKEIGWGAFFECSNLTKVTISGEINMIREYTFFGCQNLKAVIIDNDKLETIEPDAFLNCPETVIYLPDTAEYRRKVSDSVFPNNYKYSFL